MAMIFSWAGSAATLSRKTPRSAPNRRIPFRLISLSVFGDVIDDSPVDEDKDRMAADIERAARPDHQVSILALFDASDPVVEPQRPRTVDGDALERRLLVQAQADSHGRLQGEELLPSCHRIRVDGDVLCPSPLILRHDPQKRSALTIDNT